MAKKILLLDIDPQRSFCAVVPPDEQQVRHDGELCVPGAWDDMVRVADFVSASGDMIDDIIVTLDSHDQLHIAHPLWWVNVKTGQPPQPFTVMRYENKKYIGSTMDANGKFVDVGEFRTVRQRFHQHSANYLTALAASGRYPHVIWPYHCLIGTPGHNIVEPLAAAFLEWERGNVARVKKVTKGSNMGVEHFSPVRAEVVDPNDPYTALNTDLVQSVMEFDEILLTGEAKGHCLANTVRDLANEFAQTDEFIKKCVLFTDATSDVPGFEKYGDDFLREMTKRGMKTTTTKDYLA